MALLVAMSTLWGGAAAAFSALTSNPTNNWTTGVVSLSDDDLGGALFTAPNLLPGDSGVRCIVVTYGGSVPGAVKLYAAGYTTTLALGSSLDLTIEEGSGSTFAGSGPSSCTGFTASGTLYTGTVAGFAAASTGYGTGVGSFAPTGTGQTRVFRFSYTLSLLAPTSTQSGTAGVGFTWEAAAA